MLRQLPVGTVNLRRVPVSRMVNIGFQILRYQRDGGTSEKLKHIHMNMDPVFHLKELGISKIWKFWRRYYFSFLL